MGKEKHALVAMSSLHCRLKSYTLLLRSFLLDELDFVSFTDKNMGGRADGFD